MTSKIRINRSVETNTETAGTVKFIWSRETSKRKTDKRCLSYTHITHTLNSQPGHSGVISHLVNYPNFRQASLHHTEDLTGKFDKLIDCNYKVFPTRQDIYGKQTKFRWEEFVDVIQHLTDIMRKPQGKQWDLMRASAQLHLDYAKEGQELNLYLDQQLKQHI